jgi:3-isopropylmalate dehydrogenase
LLSHLNNPVAAKRIESAVAADLATRGDKKRSTTEVAEAIYALL